jgi:hypothetical protein
MANIYGTHLMDSDDQELDAHGQGPDTDGQLLDARVRGIACKALCHLL